MFWSMRELGLFKHSAFAEWYQRFIGHFVRIYESAAPNFVRESARWSEDSSRIAEYHSGGNRMTDIIGMPIHEAQGQLRQEELATGNSAWPYELRGSRT